MSMKKFDFPLFADVLFYTASAWFILVGMMRWFRMPTWVCFTVATLLALAIGGILFLFLSSRHKKRYLGKKELEAREKLMLHLALETDERVRAALLDAFLKDGKEAHCEQDALSMDETPLIPIFTMQPVSADAVAHLLKVYQKRPFIIACNALSPEAEKLLSAFARRAMTAADIYELFNRTGMPEPLICGEIPRKSVRTKLRRAFSKRNAYPFFVSGAALLVMSLFVFFPVYYLVTGSLLIIAAILIRIFGYVPQG